MLRVLLRNSSNYNFSSVLLKKNDLVLPILKNHLLASKMTVLGLPHTCEKNLNSLNHFDFVMQSIRLKSTKNIKKQSSKSKFDSGNEYEVDEELQSMEAFDDDNDDENYIKGKGIELKLLSLSSLRIDALLKNGFNISRRSIEESFYEKKIWVNEKLLMKKSESVKIGDEIDIIKGISEENENLILVKRIEVLNISKDNDDDDKVLIKIRKTKSLLVENYQNNQM